MNYRRLLLRGGIVLAIPLGARSAAQDARVREIAVVYNSPPKAEVETNEFSRAIKAGLGERGWVVGKNLRIHWRTAGGHAARIPEVFDEIVLHPLDVLVTFDNPRPALARTLTTPVVSTFSYDPTRIGIVKALGRPGGNLTGVYGRGEQLWVAQLGLMKEAAPHISRVAAFQGGAGFLREAAEKEGRPLGVEIISPPSLAMASQAPGAIAECVRKGAQGLLLGDVFAWRDPKNLRELEAAARKHRLLAVSPVLDAVSIAPGVTLAYGPAQADWQAAIVRQVDRILRGANPGDLAIEQLEPRLHVNRGLAKAIGIEIPPSVLLRAERVVD